MVELNDFSPDSSNITLEDLIPESASTLIKSDLTNKSVAANVAVLSTGNVEDTYRDTLSSLENGVDVFSTDGPLGYLMRAEYQKANESLVDIIGDPSISDDTKLALSNQFEDIISARTTPKSMVSSVTAASAGADDSIEADGLRVNAGLVIDRVNRYKDGVQQIVNANNARNNVSVMKTAGNLLELLVPMTEGTTTAAMVRDMQEGDGNFFYNTFLQGEGMNDVVQKMKTLPLDKRLEFAQHIAEIVNKHDGLVMADNELISTMKLTDLLETEDVYDGWDRTLDNMISVLDTTIFGGMLLRTIRGGVRGAKAATTSKKVKAAQKATEGITEQSIVLVNEIIKGSVRSDVKPGSLARNVKDTNSDVALALDHTITGDHTGEAAEAATGTTRTEAIADVRLPEIAEDSGKVTNKTKMDANDEVKTFVDDEGAIQYAPIEKITMRSKAIEMISRDEMFTIDAIEGLPDGVSIRGVYGQPHNGYLFPQDALELAEYNLRGLGVDRNNMTLLKFNDEGKWVPTDINTHTPGNYLVGVDYRYKFNPADNTRFFSTDVKRNFFDRMNIGTSGAAGTLQRTFLDPASMLNPLLTKGANVAVDRTFGLEKILSDQGRVFSKEFAKLPKERRLMLEDEIKRANKEGTDFNYTTLKANGYSEQEIKTLRDWKDVWDTVYWLENRDLAKNLRNNGFLTLVDRVNDTQIFARPIKQRGRVKDNVMVYDYLTETLRPVGKQELDDLYEAGGFIAKMKSKKVVGEESSEFVLSTEKQGGSYLRAINDHDQVLNYRNGYYQVQYKAPRFIEKIVKDKNGRELYRGAVATAETTRDANLTVRRMAAAVDADEVNTIEFVVRGDVKGNPMDDAYDLAFSRGRTAQRSRGERLHDGSGTGIQAGSDNHILDPVESLTKSIRSISRRTQMREYLDSAKARFMRQYENTLSKADKQGSKIWPTSRSEIGTKGISNKEIADARTTWEYINYLEHGYVNSISDMYKGMLNILADGIGEFSTARKTKIGALEAVEKGVRKVAAMRSPDDAARSAAFKLYLSLNPLRQLMVQTHQAIRLNYINPKYMADPRGAAAQTSVLLAGLSDVKPLKPLLKMAGMTEKEAAKMVVDFKRSGLNSAVDANNLVRGDLQKLADLTTFEKTTGVLNQPVKMAQRIGFDAGEQGHMMITWLAFRDKAIKAGQKLDAATLDEIGAEARNWGYSMNAAGDLAYNRNFFSMIMQFAQIPHKAFMANLTNRTIPPHVRARSMLADTLMFGVPTAGGVGLFISDLIPDDMPDLKKTLMRGVEELVLNKILTVGFDQQTDVDFSSLAPTDISGFMSMFYENWTSAPGDIVANSPSGQLFFGGNPRVTNLLKDGMSFFGLGPEEELTPATWEHVWTSAAKVMSGGSNALKAFGAFKTGQTMNSRGQVVDKDVNKLEAVFQAFGLGTITKAANFQVSREVYERSKTMEDDFNVIYKDHMRRLSDEGLTAAQIVETNRAYGYAYEVWGIQTKRGKEILKKNLTRDMKDPSNVLYENIKKLVGNGGDLEVMKQLIIGSGLPEDSKETLNKIIDDANDINNYKDEE